MSECTTSKVEDVHPVDSPVKGLLVFGQVFRPRPRPRPRSRASES